ncbi:SEC-C metal-binding domain-containing protein [Paenibacillus tyrfis]|uniref:SEC-C metal-binding domain-containing protein n=1 Tax=Paenibacillus tyrfis TaxID=1501230 RepID=UPI000B589A11|nr:SEC-C metal-binding domain-containing protein [Paenibacillus tyrfis]
MNLRKIGRNEPCPCGSGKKYKHCCLLTGEAPQLQAAAPNTGSPSNIRPSADQGPSLNAETVQTLIEVLDWPQEIYESVAEQLAGQMAGTFDWQRITEAVALWHAYASHERPQIRKADVMLAAMEYAIGSMHGVTEVTQSALSAKYNVSSGSIAQRAQKITEFAEQMKNGK